MTEWGKGIRERFEWRRIIGTVPEIVCDQLFHSFLSAHLQVLGYGVSFIGEAWMGTDFLCTVW